MHAEGLRDPIQLIQFPYDGIRVGQNWPAMKESLRSWVLADAVALSDGEQSVQVAGLPFAIDIEKAGLASGRQPGLFFGRFTPAETDLTVRLKTLIERKAAKLGPHVALGRTTVLLIESDDIALMNRSKLERAIADAFPRGIPEQINELWYADTSVPGSPPIVQPLILGAGEVRRTEQ